MIWQAGRLVTGSQVGRRCHVLIWYRTGNLDCGRKTKINFSPKRKTKFSSSSFKVLKIMFKFDNLWLLGLHWDVCKHTVTRWKEVNGRIYFLLLLNHLIIIKIIIMNFTYLNPLRLFFYILLLSFRFFSSFVVLSRQLMRRSDSSLGECASRWRSTHSGAEWKARDSDNSAAGDTHFLLPVSFLQWHVVNVPLCSSQSCLAFWGPRE